ncbi:helix-turn-helix protein [Rhodobacter sp. JA431]|uniref:helix-turn-helix transcriptional regulator n=1 Tax=Rhodobacter sp. JA431 TaxID=570013 RepID=UPI000BCCA7F7|nr:helix-turn-helix domain-containing protein [Rhodobacter sp. JA431]SOC10174.1 helix-turn-helix protein [Rhodobacter sp. JA431]
MSILERKFAKTYLNTRELAALLEVSVATIWRWKKTGYLPAPTKIGGMTRWTKAEIIEQFPELANDAA